MSTSTGNNPNGHSNPGDPQPTPQVQPATRMLVPDLVYPGVKWQPEDYASLQGRLDLFDDFIVLTKFNRGAMTESYVVDPAEVAAALAGIDLNSGLLPDSCLFWSKKDGYDRLGIYIPPQVRLVTVRNESGAWRIPMPGLIFLGHDYNYSVWAVKERPTDTRTPLFMAPCPNVHPEGVCRGNAPFPRAGTTTIWQAVDAFFSSRFNHDLANQKSKAFPDDVLDQWRLLNQANAEIYPLDDLLPVNLTLGRLIDANA